MDIVLFVDTTIDMVYAMKAWSHDELMEAPQQLHKYIEKH